MDFAVTITTLVNDFVRNILDAVFGFLTLLFGDLANAFDTRQD